MNLDNLIQKCVASGQLSRDEILYLLNLDGDDDVARLLRAADDVRKAECGDAVQIRALVEISNTCARSCLYCGIRAPNKDIVRYRMPADEIVELAGELNKKGLKTIVMQSGEDPYYTAGIVADIVRRIKDSTQMAITLCFGERPEEDYRLWKQAGADRYLLRHETANRDLYAKLHPDSDFDHRMRCLYALREIGYQVGAGCMVGIPGQSVDNMADDIEFFRDFQPDMAGIGPYIPHPDTPFAGNPAGDVQMTLKMVALARIVTRNALLPATTAIGSIAEMGCEMALDAGADVVMPNYTPLKYRVHYEIYPNKRCITEDPAFDDLATRLQIQATNRRISNDPGHSRKLKISKTLADTQEGVPIPNLGI
ncbi:MAG: [FeFe] hydrogenase H-cluster radical SAM maturase HydE [Armatimonadetes bacterium]|jgi:biotin synthase|nr:[FeFe] hydrogenase H-cluster radical SAM maturase HydE [Armatimonadota bacterium]